MRPSSTVQKHGVGASDGHVEGSDICLAVFKGDVAAVDTAVHGSACRVGGRLRDSVVAVGELELDNVADCGGDGVGDESVLGAADNDWDDLAGATEWVGLFLVSDVKMEWGWVIHLMLGSLLTVLKAGPGSAFAVATRAREKMNDFIVVVVDGSSYKKKVSRV
jgi:hypothetical protein